jgi:hypothetical protein
MILLCPLPQPDDPRRICGGVVGGVPDGAFGVGSVERIEHARPGNYAMRCGTCRRYVEVCPPMDRAA